MKSKTPPQQEARLNDMEYLQYSIYRELCAEVKENPKPNSKFNTEEFDRVKKIVRLYRQDKNKDK
jgi:hypothetical protein